VLVTATPLVDAAYFFAVAILLYLTVAKKYRTFAAILPVLILSKETILPFLALPLLTDMRKLGAFWLALAAAAGAWLNPRHRYHVIPRVVVAVIPIGLGYALISGNLGRMFFVAFPAVIAYALVSIDHVSRRYSE